MSRFRIQLVTLIAVTADLLGAGASDLAALPEGQAAGQTWPVALVLDRDGSRVQRIDPGRQRSGDGDVVPVATTETTLLSESFESSWPAAPWSVHHPEGAAEVDWGRTNHRATDGSHSIWCAQAGADTPGVGGTVPESTMSWVVAGPFDLTEAVQGSLTFDLWLRTEQFHDVFMWLVSTDGESFSGEATSTDTGGWETIDVDLTDWGHEGDVTGAEYVWIAFVYQSDHRDRYEGAYLDNLSLVADSGTVAEVGITYTSQAHFERGNLVGLVADDDSLQLSTGWSTLPYLWVPGFAGTVSKVDTVTGTELARYRTGPDQELDPSPAAVDLYGGCWVGNRGAGTVVKIGLSELGGCVDRNNNRRIDTATDSDGDGNISEDELLAWGEDECVLYEVLLVADHQETYTPGTAHDGYQRNQLQALAVDRENNVWVGVGDDKTYYQVAGDSGEVLQTLDVADRETHPFAAVIDRSGILWSASWPNKWVLRVDPASGEKKVVLLDHGSRGLALDQVEHLFVSGYGASLLSRIDTGSAEVDWVYSSDWRSNGLAVTSDGDLWVAGGAAVKRYSVDGVFKATIPVNNSPTGLAVDAAGKVWVMGFDNSVIIRIDPDFNRADLQKTLVGNGRHDSAGDMTGMVARTVTTTVGVWNIVYDSRVTDVAWGTISWNGTAPEGTAITVRVRSSPDQVAWSSWEQAVSGTALLATPASRYLQVEATLQRLSGDGAPVIEDLTVAPVALVSDFSWEPANPVAGETVSFTDATTGDPTSWSWDFGDQGSSSEQNPSHVFAAQGSYLVTLQVSNAYGEGSTAKSVTVGSGCELTCTATVPATGQRGATIPFSASATAVGCTGEVSYSWLFGDGNTASEQSPQHAYAAGGTFSWQMVAATTGATCTQSGTIAIGESGCTSDYWVAVATHAAGAGGSAWRTDLGLLGVGDQTTTAELRLYGSDAVTIGEVTVEPQGMVNLVDVVDWISTGSEASGALQVCADQPLIVTSRTYSQLGDDDPCFAGGTFGQRLDGVASTSGLSQGETGTLPQLIENGAYRTNLGFTNTGTEDAVVEVTLFDAAGTQVALFTVDLAPGAWEQENRPYFRRGDREDVDAGWARVVVNSGNGILVYASVIDSVTQDASTVLPR